MSVYAWQLPRRLALGIAGAAIGVAVTMAFPADGLAAGFDGTWAVTQVCPKAPDGALGYSWSYSVTIRDGTLDGAYQALKGGGNIHLHGSVGADGKGLLQANGTTGPVEYSVGHVPVGTAYHYHVEVSFDGASGTGYRVEQRQCSFAFAKRG